MIPILKNLWLITFFILFLCFKRTISDTTVRICAVYMFFVFSWIIFFSLSFCCCCCCWNDNNFFFLHYFLFLSKKSPYELADCLRESKFILRYDVQVLVLLIVVRQRIFYTVLGTVHPPYSQVWNAKKIFWKSQIPTTSIPT